MKSFIFLFPILLTAGLTCFAQSFVTNKITANTLITSSFINDNEGWLSDNSGLLWHTTDAGQTWSSISTEKFLKLNFTDALHGFALTTETAFKTTDGGNTWSTLSIPGNIGKALYFLDSNIGFISGHGVIYRTSNGGTDWSIITTDGVDFVDYFFLNSLIGIAASYDDELNKCIWRTTDGGETWSNVYAQANYFIKSVWFTNESSGWAAGYYDEAGIGKEPLILHSIDGGVTWQNNYRNDEIVSRGESFTDIRFKNELEGFAIADLSYDVYTTDGGLSWSLTHDSETIEISPWNYKAISGFHTLYIIGKDGYVTTWK
jgi:photosystem II stability/assembly factor-like uncharacterized protein